MRQRDWNCLTCGAPMHALLAASVKKGVEGIVPDTSLIHVCGNCKELHMVTPKGRLRLLTVGERFAAEANCGNTLARIRGMAFPPRDEPTATLVLPWED